MVRIYFLCSLLAVFGTIAARATGQELSVTPLRELRVLYVGSERAKEYGKFLKEYVGEFDSVSREDFKPERASRFDVVLLDWPQTGEISEMRSLRSPLGDREQWNRPTVLLGSAGLRMAVAWKMQGGSGCTCMDPIAYGFRKHRIFEQPFPIPLDKMIRIPTPDSFLGELSDSEIEVLPLVDNIEKKWEPGWCTYTGYFDKNPDVETFCGGVNRKTPTAGGLWRQGNFLHFGFEQSPRQMNESGRMLLLNSIEYISHFSQDRPIATTPSVFGGDVAKPRRSPANWLKREGIYAGWAIDLFEPAIRSELKAMDSIGSRLEWCQANSKYFAPGKDTLLRIDPDLQAIELAFDTPEFFRRVLDDLDSTDAEAIDRSKRLLDRYVPCGPGAYATSKEWREWYELNKPYMFALDTGDYRWYIDELAKTRKVPSSELRGPSRADKP
jgi:hypothetical protein